VIAAAVTAGVVVVLSLAWARGPQAVGAQAAASEAPPNFLLVLVDDQARNSFTGRFMPKTFRDVVRPGTSFENGLAAPPLCCPDRAGILTGQYPHNHGVFSNHPGYADLRDPQDTIPVWLHDAGYATGMFGKFMNHYSHVGGLGPAPGFERWFAFLDAKAHYYDYEVSDDGNVRSYGHERAAYSTDVLTRKTGQFIQQSAQQDRPFFAWLGYHAPHVDHVAKGPCAGKNPSPPDRSGFKRFAGVKLPRPPSFNERRNQDKPRPVRKLDRLSRQDLRELRLRWQCTLGAMSEVDRGVGQLIGELRSDGELDSTIVIYVSDNGFFFGEHRIKTGKAYPYEPALNVPFAVRVPPRYRGSAAPGSTGAVVANQDIAPTVLDYVNANGGAAQPCAAPGDCRRLDGRALQPLLGGPGRWPSGRGVLAEIDARRRAKGDDSECQCAYAAIRTRGYLYSEPVHGRRELYDLRRDPGELQNRIRSRKYAARRQALAARLDTLRRCSGIEGRDPPTSAPFCE
jgi:N-acetylglucosamine-6-sulfatase